MKYWTTCHPGEVGQYVQETFSEDQIIESYFKYWESKMLEVNLPELISKENCINDWCSIHWAAETDEFGNKLNG